MANDSLKSEPGGKIDIVASEACTRSGAFALLLAVVLFLLAAYWLDEKNDEAAGRYVDNRENLALYIDTLDNDPAWQEYKRSHPDAESTPMAQLLDATAQITMRPPARTPPKTAPTDRNTPPARTTQALAGAPTAPSVPTSAPTGLTAQVIVQVALYEMPRIQEFLVKLNDSELLTRSRDASNFFDFSIVRWAQKRASMMYGNAVTGVCETPVLEVSRKSHKSAHYVPQLDDKALLNCLTLSGVRELAKFELPTITNPAPMGRRVAQDVELSPGSLPRNPYAATIIAQALLFFVLTYFWAFAREAVSSDAFPSRGTLFGAFSRSRLLLGIFFLALWVPFVACCGVALASEETVMAIGIVPVFLVTLFAERTLEEKEFFKQWQPVTSLERKYSSWRLRRDPPEKNPDN